MIISFIRPYENKTRTFGKDKVHIYTDYDRTLSPAVTSDAKKPKGSAILKKVAKSFEEFSTLMQTMKDHITTHVSSGRSIAEYENMYILYGKRNIELPKVDSIIVKEGSDEYFENKAQNGGFSYTIKNKNRYEKLKQQTKWDNQTIREKTHRLIRQNGLTTLECKTTLSKKNYGKRSVFSRPSLLKPNTVLIRDIGDMRLFLGMPPSIPEHKAEQTALQVADYLHSQKIKFELVKKPKDKECNDFLSYTFTPILKGEVLSKAYDPNLQIQKAKKEGDLVIVAGDGKNDLEMLNPLSYISKKTKNLDISDPQRVKEFLDKQPDLKEKIKKLPLISIIVQKKDEKCQELENLNAIFGQDSEYKKIITIEEGSLAKGIKQAIKEYQKQNKKFKLKLI